MSRRSFPARMRRRRGVAAVELAFTMAACVALFPAVVAAGSVLLHYAALHKAVHEGARYIASLPPQALGTEAAASQAVTVARTIVTGTLAQAGLQVTLPPDRVIVTCNGAACDGTLPATVAVSASITLPLPAWLFYSSDGTLQVLAFDSMRYAYHGSPNL